MYKTFSVRESFKNLSQLEGAPPAAACCCQGQCASGEWLTRLTSRQATNPTMVSMPSPYGDDGGARALHKNRNFTQKSQKCQMSQKTQSPKFDKSLKSPRSSRNPQILQKIAKFPKDPKSKILQKSEKF